MTNHHINIALQSLLLGTLAIASLCSTATAAPLTGLPLQPEQRMARALAKTDTAHCDGGASVEHLLDGTAQGQPFRLFKLSCSNTSGESRVVAFHDGSRYTRVLRFAALQIASPVSIAQDRIVYEAIVEKSADASVQAVAFARRFEPVRGTLLK